MAIQSLRSYWTLGHCKALIAAGITVATIGAFADSADIPHTQPDGTATSGTIADSQITEKVRSRFGGDTRLRKSDVSITTTNGVVTLTGSASSVDAWSVAETIAGGVDGVRRVDNQLQTPSPADAIDTSEEKPH